jgi:uncharacterized protein YeaO (DUF488 family)/DNA-binding MarR family transcriptional regulator
LAPIWCSNVDNVVRFQLEDADYQRLLRLRTSLRQYLHWSEQQAQAVGLTPAHHQFLLAIRGHDDPRGPTISDVAGYLLLKHHSTVELAQRVGLLGLIDRVPDPDDGRVVRLRLTGKGAAALEKLAGLHLEELSRLANGLVPMWQSYLGGQSANGLPSPDGLAAAGVLMHPVRARLVYDPPGEDDGCRVLVDRLWPRGIRKDAESVEQWSVDVAPSSQLRRWYGHKAERFGEFAERYRDELRSGLASQSLDRLGDLARTGPLTLLTASRDVAHSGAAVLAEEIQHRAQTATATA